MFNRRDFVQAGALTAIPLALGASLVRAEEGSSQSALPRASLHRVVFDERFQDSVDFARAAGRLNLTTTAIRGDVTALWYHDLYHLWRKGPAAIAGMTTTDALFCLETLGNDAGLRLVMRGDHAAVETGVDHRLSGPQSLLQHASLEHSGARWSAHMAQLLSRCPATRDNRMQLAARSQCSGAVSRAGQPALVSWVLAPVSRRRSFFV